jgi:hypothetical protein
VNTGFWWGDRRERGRLEYLGVDGSSRNGRARPGMD